MTPVKEQIMQDTVGFLKNYPDGLMVDEAHHYPDLFSEMPTIQNGSYNFRNFNLTENQNNK